MTDSDRARSFEKTSRATITLPDGRTAHRDHIAHSERLVKKFYNVRPGVWSFVGNGLSNQSFIEGPEGIIAIDTGESIEEMAHAIATLREHTSTPIVAVMYTHFHYITGTKAVVTENAGKPIPIWGHERIKHNREGATAEIGPTYTRGLVEQFAILMPESGADGNVNVGLGRFWRDPMHAPFTTGFMPPTNTFGDEPSTHTIEVNFVYDGGFGNGGELVLSVDGSVVATGRIDKTVPIVFSMSGETFDVGVDTGSPVGPYPHHFPCSAKIHTVTLERLDEPSDEVKALMRKGEFKASLSTQ